MHRLFCATTAFRCKMLSLCGKSDFEVGYKVMFRQAVMQQSEVSTVPERQREWRRVAVWALKPSICPSTTVQHPLPWDPTVTAAPWGAHPPFLLWNMLEARPCGETLLASYLRSPHSSAQEGSKRCHPFHRCSWNFCFCQMKIFLKWGRSDGCRIELRPVTGSTCTWMGFAVGDVFVWLFVSPPLLGFTPTSFIMTSHMGASWANW